jgi:hypothetical protein
MVVVPAVAIGLALSGAAQDKQASLPLVITQMWIERADRLPAGEGLERVEVLNSGQRTILAWGVRFVVKRSDGTRVQSGGFSVDSASSLPEDRLLSLAPGQTTHNEGGGALALQETILTDGLVTFVIFDDDTALGDERELAFMFARRRTRQTFWRKMLAIVDDATSHPTDPSVMLARIGERMEAEPDPQFREGTWYNEILARMSARRMEPAGTTPQRVLDDLRTTVAAQKANADAHAIRR